MTTGHLTLEGCIVSCGMRRRAHLPGEGCPRVCYSRVRGLGIGSVRGGNRYSQPHAQIHQFHRGYRPRPLGVAEVGVGGYPSPWCFDRWWWVRLEAEAGKALPNRSLGKQVMSWRTSVSGRRAETLQWIKSGIYLFSRQRWESDERQDGLVSSPKASSQRAGQQIEAAAASVRSVVAGGRLRRRSLFFDKGFRGR